MRAIAEIVAGELAIRAPKDTGTLARILAKSVHPLPSGAVGVGSYDDLGSDPEDDAPPNTISDFLDAFPQYRKDKPSKQTLRYPWHNLGNQDFEGSLTRDWLDQHRRKMGQFGGVVGKAPYWHVVETGYPGPKAGVQATFYISLTDDAIPEIEARVFATTMKVTA